MGQISESPLFIDDSPNMSRWRSAKCRRLKQQHNLKLVVIDYLQADELQARRSSRASRRSRSSPVPSRLLAKEPKCP